MLNGKKTYVVSILGIIWSVLGWIFGWVEPTNAVNLIFGFLTAMGLRHGIK